MAYTIDKLYGLCDELTAAKDEIEQHGTKFKEIIIAAKEGQDANVKKLASQLIGRFFRHFPALHDYAFEAVFDLCEDDDVNIRKQSIRDLPNLCKDKNKENTIRIAGVLTQLLQTDDPQELNLTTNSLISVISFDAPSALRGIFLQMELGDDLVKERCYKFFQTKFKMLSKEIITREVEDMIIEHCKKFVLSANGEEFVAIIHLLNQMHLAKTPVGKREIIALIERYLEIDQPFAAHDEHNLLLLILGAKNAVPLFNALVPSNNLVKYVCDNVLQHLDEFKSADEGVAHRETLLKIVAEMAQFVGKYDGVDESLAVVFAQILRLLPTPPEDDLTAYPSFEFSTLECLLFTFYKLAAHAPKFLTDNDERLKDFRLRMQYFARGVQGALKKLNEKTDATDASVVRTRKMIGNLNKIIKDLYRNPPVYTSSIGLSWKEDAIEVPKKVETTPEKKATKRHAPITFDDEKKGKIGKVASGNNQIYTPPGGKYSNKMRSYDVKPRGRNGDKPRSGRRRW